MSNTTMQIYDSHAHLISDDLERYPQDPVPVRMDDAVLKGSQMGPGVMGFPGGYHGDKPTNLKPTAEQLHEWMAQENVVGLTAVQKALIYRTNNDYIVDAAALFPGEMDAVIVVDPTEEATLPLIRDLSKRGVVGIRFFPIGVSDKVAWLSSPQSMKTWELANELGIVVDIEAPVKDAESLFPLIVGMADRFPNLSIVLDHIFLPELSGSNYGISGNYEDFVKRKNIYVKWTSLNMDIVHSYGHSTAAVLRAAVDFFGADRVMWGSDIGTSSGTYKEMIERAMESIALLNDEEKQKVMHDTGRRVFTSWDNA